MEFILEHFLGTLVNFVGVIIAGVCGALLKRGVPKRFSDIIMSAMALCVIYIGIDGVLAEAPAVNEESFLNAGLMKILVMIISMAIGTAIGELIDIDKQLNRLGAFLGNLFKRKLSRDESADAADKFAEGFVGCSLLFCVGAMAINGAILDAQGEPGTLFAKTIIDMITVFVMSSTLGIGCAFSAFSVLIYQGVFNIVGLLLVELVSASTIAYMSCVGSLAIIVLGLNVLGVTKVKTANMVPAMFVAIGVEALLKLIFAA